MKTRREILIAAATWPALAWAGAARAQAPAKVRRIGFISPYTRAVAAPLYEAFRLGLRDLGWVEGKNISIEYRSGEGSDKHLPKFAAELVRLQVDVIVTSVTTDALAAQKATRTIPIVIVQAGNPVGIGLAESLARPGGNVTGVSVMSQDLVGKRLELLKDIVPKLSRVAVLWNPEGVGSSATWKEIQAPARQLEIQLHSMEVRSADDLDRGFEDAARARAGALYATGNVVVTTNMKRIATLAMKNRLPSIFQRSEFTDAGGLVVYGADRHYPFRRAATFVDKILKGANPGELPIEQATKFELVVNLKTAKAIGLTLPQSFLMRADKVIE